MDWHDTDNQLAIIVCAQNAGQRLTFFLDALGPSDLHLIVVTARTHDPTADVLDAWRHKHPHVPIHEIALSPRRSLMSAFATAASLGCTHAVTLLADAAFDLCDIAALVHSAALHPSALITGYRTGKKSRGPFVRICNFMLWLETGVHVRDSSCASRVYPLRLIDTIRGRHKRHLRHTDLLAWAAWAGCPIVEARMVTNAKMPAARRWFLMDMQYKLHELDLHGGLLLRELSGLPYPHYGGGAQRQPLWRGLWQWFNPLHAWRELRQGGITRQEMAAGVAVGVFVANLPAYFFQTVIALYAAKRLHLNPVAVLAGTQASWPPAGPMLIAAAVFVGHLILHGSRLAWHDLSPWNGNFLARIPDWLVGSIVVGIATAALSFLASNLLFRLFEQRATETLPANEDQEPVEILAASPATLEHMA